MALRPLGSTAIEVSPIGLGTAKFGRNTGVKYPRGFALPDDAAIDRLLGAAGELGVNLLDTAPAYGSSEQRLGRALKGHRDRWVIATKAGEEFAGGRSRFDFSPAHLRLSVERSLSRLATDRLDIVAVHSNGDDRRIINQDGALRTLADLKRAGLVRAIGFSGKTVAGGLLALEEADLVMVTFNPLATAERRVIAEARARAKGVLIKKALNSGHLDAFGAENPVQAAMRCVFAEPGVTSALVGTLSADHLAEAVQAADRALGQRAA